MQISNNFAVPAFRGVSAEKKSNVYMDNKAKADTFVKSANAPAVASKDYSVYANKDPEEIVNKFAGVMAKVEYNKPLFGFFNRKTTYSKSEMNEVKQAMMEDAPTNDAGRVAFAEKCDRAANVVKSQGKNDHEMSPATIANMFRNFDKDGMRGVEAMATAKTYKYDNKYTSAQMAEAINTFSNEQMAKLADAPNLMKTNMPLENIQGLLNSNVDAETLNKLGDKVAELENLPYYRTGEGFFVTNLDADLKYTNVAVTQDSDGKPQRYDVKMFRNEKDATEPDFAEYKELRFVLDDQLKKRSSYSAHSERKTRTHMGVRIKYDKDEKIRRRTMGDATIDFMLQLGENGPHDNIWVGNYNDFEYEPEPDPNAKVTVKHYTYSDITTADVKRANDNGVPLLDIDKEIAKEKAKRAERGENNEQ